MAMKTQLTTTIFFSVVGISRIFVNDTAIPKILLKDNVDIFLNFVGKTSNMTSKFYKLKKYLVLSLNLLIS